MIEEIKRVGDENPTFRLRAFFKSKCKLSPHSSGSDYMKGFWSKVRFRDAPGLLMNSPTADFCSNTLLIYCKLSPPSIISFNIQQFDSVWDCLRRFSCSFHCTIVSWYVLRTEQIFVKA